MAKSPVKIAELNKRIVIEEYSRTPDGQGGFVETWATFATVWAKIKPVEQKERIFGQQVSPLTTHKITIRKLNNINSKMRITHEGRIFQINGQILMDEREFFHLINAIEGSAS